MTLPEVQARLQAIVKKNIFRPLKGKWRQCRNRDCWAHAANGEPLIHLPSCPIGQIEAVGQEIAQALAMPRSASVGHDPFLIGTIDCGASSPAEGRSQPETEAADSPQPTSSTFTPSVRNKTPKTTQALSSPEDVMTSEPQVLSNVSPSKLDALMESEDFRLAWDNAVRFQVSRQLLHLRRFREWSQTTLAKEMRTSQSAIARIESGDENISADTIERAVKAMNGRFSISISPAEMHFPAFPLWWTLAHSGIASSAPPREEGPKP